MTSLAVFLLVVDVVLGGSLLAVCLHYRAMTATLRESQRRIEQSTRAALNSLPHGVALVSPEGKVEMTNRVAESLFGLVPGQFPPAAAQKWLLPLLNHVSSPQADDDGRADSPIQMFDQGRERFFLPQAVAIKDPQDKTVGITILLVDTTQLRQVDEAKSSLLSSVSHELKTPLTSIQMALHLLLEDAPPALTKNQLELLKTARDDADRLHQLIQQTLDTARRKPV